MHALHSILLKCWGISFCPQNKDGKAELSVGKEEGSHLRHIPLSGRLLLGTIRNSSKDLNERSIVGPHGSHLCPSTLELLYLSGLQPLPLAPCSMAVSLLPLCPLQSIAGQIMLSPAAFPVSLSGCFACWEAVLSPQKSVAPRGRPA